MIQRLTSIVNFWRERKVYGTEIIAALMRAILSPSTAPAAAPAQVPICRHVMCMSSYCTMTPLECEPSQCNTTGSLASMVTAVSMSWAGHTACHC